MNDRNPHSDVDPALAEVLESAYAERVDVEVAARHLWSIHRAAGTLPSMQRGVARTRRALVSLVAGSMLFMSSGGALAASGSALPGDVLYPVKRGVEKARIVLTVTRDGDARLHLALAKRRMSEAREVVSRRPAAVPTLVREALDSLEVARRSGDADVASEAVDTQREAVEELDLLLATIDDGVAEQLRESRKETGGNGEMSLSSQSPSSAPTTASSSPEASAEPTDTSESPSASGSPSETSGSESTSPSPSSSASESTSPSPSSSSSTSPSPSASASPSPSSSTSASPSPSSTTSPSPSSSPSETTSPSEPAPASSPTRKYEGVEDTTVQADDTPEPTPSS